MTNQSKTQKAEKQVENLELNRETLQDLTEQDGDRARGGMIGPPVTRSQQFEVRSRAEVDTLVPTQT